MPNLKVVIVTYNWPPRNAIGTHRPYSWAKYWSGLGADITVITACKYAFDEPLDLDFPSLDGVTVHEVPYRSTSKFPLLLLRFPRIKAFLKKIKNILAGSYNMSIDVREGWRSASSVVARQLANEADIVISTYGPSASHLIAYDMKSLNKELCWIADYRDLWSLNYTKEYTDSQKGRVSSEEVSTVGKLADEITTVSEGLAYRLEELLGRKAMVFPNGFDPEEVNATFSGKSRIRQQGRLKIVYTGMIYPQFQDPSILLEALDGLIKSGDIKSCDVEVDFYGSCADLIERSGFPKKYSFVTVFGHVPREQVLRAQRDADLLLLLDSVDAAKAGILTGKVFEYLVSGVPVINLGGVSDSAIAKLLEETGVGISLGRNIAYVKDAILELKRFGSGVDWFAPNGDAIQNYSRERIALRMYEDLLVGSAKP